MEQFCINGLGRLRVNKNNIEALKRLLTHHEVEIELLEDRVKELEHENKELEGHWAREKEFRNSLFCISGTIASNLYRWIQFKKADGHEVFNDPKFQDFFIALSDYCKPSSVYGIACCGEKRDEGCTLGEPKKLGGLIYPTLGGLSHDAPKVR